MQKRQLGRTGERLSVVGFGGIVVMDTEPSEAERLVAEAVERRGINYFDVAPSYGNAQERLGPALRPYRDDVFLACKTGQRDAAGAEEELHRSLKLLHTDHFDLYQLHCVGPEDVEKIAAPGGALETLVRARDKGLARHLGFSAHCDAAAVAMMGRFEFDTVLFPINWACWQLGGPGPGAVAAAQKRGMGILALKALAKRKWKPDEPRQWPKAWYCPVDSPEEASLALRFTLSQPVTAAVSPGHADLLWWACDAAERPAPLSADEAADLAARAAGLEHVFSQAGD